MTERDRAIEQLAVIRSQTGAKIVARSAGVDFTQEEAILNLAVRFGRRPTGVRCPAATFAQPVGNKHVAVVQVADREEGGAEPALHFHALILSKTLYRELGDPFAIAERFPLVTQATGTLPTHIWLPEPLPPRTSQDVLAAMKAGDSSLLLGAAQAILDGARVAVKRDAPDPAFTRGLWQFLPDRMRGEVWPATFAFSSEIPFHAVVLPTNFDGKLVGYLTEEQTKDYPEGRYETRLQLAAETGDEAELARLFARKTSQEVLRLAVGIVLFAFAVALFLKFI